MSVLLTVSLDTLPTPSAVNLMWFLAGILMGTMAPTYYASERIRGFTRAVLKKLPYEPPAGMSAEEAFEEASGYEDDDTAQERS